jgi:hypothetical protein
MEVCVKVLRGMKDPVEAQHKSFTRVRYLFLYVVTTGFFAPAKATHKGWLRMTVLKRVRFFLVRSLQMKPCAPSYETVILNGGLREGIARNEGSRRSSAQFVYESVLSFFVRCNKFTFHCFVRQPCQRGWPLRHGKKKILLHILF